MPFVLLGLHLKEPDPLSNHAPHRAGHAHQPGEAGQHGDGGGRLEPVHENLELIHFAKVASAFKFEYILMLSGPGWRSDLVVREQDFKLGSTSSTCKVILF